MPVIRAYEYDNHCTVEARDGWQFREPQERPPIEELMKMARRLWLARQEKDYALADQIRATMIGLNMDVRYEPNQIRILY